MGTGSPVYPQKVGEPPHTYLGGLFLREQAYHIWLKIPSQWVGNRDNGIFLVV